MLIRQARAHLPEVIDRAAWADRLTVLIRYGRPACPSALLPAVSGARRPAGR